MSAANGNPNGTTNDDADDSSYDLETELIIEALYQKYRYDFRLYARSSVKRRLQHALGRFHCPTISHLQARLLHEPGFLHELIDILTVPTTEMFRDPSYFAELRTTVVPFLKTFPSLKIWIAGCSTGEEVVSFAILLKEENLLEKTTIYATDINPRVLEEASRGIYDTETIKRATLNYREAGGNGMISDYFSVAYGSARVDPKLLKNVVFSDHSLATDAVFGEMHLVSCRNVLIYFDRPLQNRATTLFKDSLVRGGFLGLGSRESLRFLDPAPAFKTISESQRLYQKS
ncbi:MAG: protein-glutamate O-methyltransferase CheR [Proteobacteria bacterium]|nr:MAG: protein-glutamate O-methyltransferase CheR [Pseudomonadota bacterium]